MADRYRLADPIEQVPLRAPVLCVHARGDDNVPYAQSEAYVAAARAAGGRPRCTRCRATTSRSSTPPTPAWAYVRDALPDLLAGRLPS